MKAQLQLSSSEPGDVVVLAVLVGLLLVSMIGIIASIRVGSAIVFDALAKEGQPVSLVRAGLWGRLVSALGTAIFGIAASIAIIFALGETLP